MYHLAPQYLPTPLLTSVVSLLISISFASSALHLPHPLLGIHPRNQGRVPRAMAGLYLWPRSTMACAIAPMGGADAAAAAPATAHAVASTASHLLILYFTHPLSQHPCSDEPATGACSNSRFFCPNIGHQGTLIAVSRVNGGQYTRAVRHR
jgi:hypothetical protein